MANSFSVSGKTAIVTGAGSGNGDLCYSSNRKSQVKADAPLGINLSLTELLLSRGCNVVLADLSLRSEAKDLVSRYNDKNSSPRAVFVTTDVTSWPDLDNMFSVALAEFGDFDVVCPGAGVYEPDWSNFWHPPGSAASKDARDSGRYAELDINLTHPIRTTQLAMSYWLHPQPIPNSQFPVPEKASHSNPKRIIHIASVAAQVPVFRAPLYGASKFAISGFVRSLGPALEADYGIRVNAVSPGLVRTPIWLEDKDKLANVNEEKDAWVTPQEVAEVMLGCVEGKERGGGVVVEVGAGGRVREVATYNDPGPDTRPEAGLIMYDDSIGVKQVHGWFKDEKVWGMAG